MNPYIYRNKKKILGMLIVMIFLGMFSFLGNGRVFAANEGDGSNNESGNIGTNIGDVFTGDNQTKYQVVAYGGWLTPSYIVKKQCVNPKDLKSNYQADKLNGDDNRDWITKILGPPINWIASQTVDLLFKPNCDQSSTVLNLSLTNDVAKIGQSVNVADNYVVMKLAGIMQWLAYGVALAYIVFYSMMYMMNQQEINPYKFAVRLGFASMLVWYAPYIAQDILDLNNVLVYALTSIHFTFDGSTTATSGDIAGAIYSYISAMVGQLGENLVLGIIALFMVFYLIGPLIQLLLWWYGRLLKIFFYTVISPIMMIMMALPQTARMATKWFKDFIGEVFSQAFVVMGMMLISLILVNLKDMDVLIGLGFVGKCLLVFAALTFMSGLPSIASSFIGGITGATPTTGSLFGMAKKMKRTAQSTGRAVKNAPAKVAGVAAAIGEKRDAIASAYKANRSQSIENSAFRGEGKGSHGALRDAAKTAGFAGLAAGVAGKMSAAGTKAKTRVSTLNRLGGYGIEGKDGISVGNRKDRAKANKESLKSQLMRDGAKSEVKGMKKENKGLKRQEAIAKYKANFATGSTGPANHKKDQDSLKQLQQSKSERFERRVTMEQNENKASEGFNEGILNRTLGSTSNGQIQGPVEPPQTAEQLMGQIKDRRKKSQNVDNFTRGTITDDDKHNKRFNNLGSNMNKPPGGGGGKKGKK